MALNIKNKAVENLLSSIVSTTDKSKTEDVCKSSERLDTFLNEEIWSQIPEELLGTKLSKAEEEQILGLGELGI